MAHKFRNIVVTNEFLGFHNIICGVNGKVSLLNICTSWWQS